MPNTQETTTSSPLTIALAWLVVVAPASWGVYMTVLKAANLFH